MQRKNGRFLRLITGTLAAILFVHPLCAVYRSTGKRLAAARQTSLIAQKSAIMPVVDDPEQAEKEPIISKKEREEEKNAQIVPKAETEQLKEKETRAEDEEETIEIQEKKLSATTDFSSTAYAFVTPLILVTLNAAIGTAIEAGTKSLIKGFGNRRALLEQKALVEENDIQLQLELLKKYPDAIKQQKTDLIRKKLIKNSILLETLDKETSASYLFSRAAYTFMIYTIFNTIAKITGYSASVTLDTLLQSVSPSHKKIDKVKR